MVTSGRVPSLATYHHRMSIGHCAARGRQRSKERPGELSRLPHRARPATRLSRQAGQNPRPAIHFGGAAEDGADSLADGLGAGAPASR